MARAIQLSVALENKPGQLAKLTAALAKAKVNIEAISVIDTTSLGIVRLVASSAPKAKAALKKAGMALTEEPVIALKLSNEPGTVSIVAKKLAGAGVNINFVYGSAAGSGKESLVVLGVDNIKKAVSVL